MVSHKLKNFAANLLALILVLSILVPSFLLASTFTTDSDLTVYPDGDQLDFGTISTVENVTQSFVVENTSDYTKEIRIANEPSVPFRYYGSSRLEILPHSTRSIPVTFAPNNTGTFTSYMTIEAVSTGESKRVRMTGSATTTRENNGVHVSASKIEFPNTLVDQVSEASITVSNNNSYNVFVSFDGDLVQPFDLPANDAVSLTPRSSMTFDISFAPKKVGKFDDSFKIRVSGGGSTSITTVRVDGESYGRVVPEVKPVTEQPTKSRYTFEDDNDAYVTLSRSTINPDMSEKTYFNIYLERTMDVSIKVVNSKNNNEVFSSDYDSVPSGQHFYEFFWDGRNYYGDKVSDGSYEYMVKVRRPHQAEIERFSGNITVIRAANRTTQPVKVYPPKTAKCPYGPQYCNTVVPQNTYENLLNKLNVTPSIVDKFGQEVMVSFETLVNSYVTVRIVDADGREVYQLAKRRPMKSGFQYGIFNWDVTVNGLPVANGVYRAEVTVDTPEGIDVDVVSFQINRVKQTSSAPYKGYIQIPQYEDIEVLSGCAGFVDVDSEDQNLCGALFAALDAGIFTAGDANDLEKVFRADDFVTRAETAAIVTRILGIDLLKYSVSVDGNLGFKDVDTGAWYMPYAKTLLKYTVGADDSAWIRKLTHGYTDSTLRPNQTITRAEFYKLLVEALSHSDKFTSEFEVNYNVKKSPFSDTPLNEQAKWYLPYADFAQKNLNKSEFARKYFSAADLTTGVRTFSPAKGVTRAEIIELLYELGRRGAFVEAK